MPARRGKGPAGRRWMYSRNGMPEFRPYVYGGTRPRPRPDPLDLLDALIDELLGARPGHAEYTDPSGSPHASGQNGHASVRP